MANIHARVLEGYFVCDPYGRADGLAELWTACCDERVMTQVAGSTARPQKQRAAAESHAWHRAIQKTACLDVVHRSRALDVIRAHADLLGRLEALLCPPAGSPPYRGKLVGACAVRASGLAGHVQIRR